MKDIKNCEIFGSLFITVGFFLFALLFWLPFGFYFGGDAYFLGKYEPLLNLYFPYVGFSLFFIFLGNFLKGNTKNISENQILFFLCFLAGIGVLSNFSYNPNFSILFLILWAIGFFMSIAGTTFWLDQKWKKIVIFIGILFGVIMHYYYPSWNISLDLIAIMAIYLSIFIRLDDLLKFRWLWILICFWVIYLSQNNGLIFLIIFLWFTSPFWLPRSRKIKIGADHWIPIIVLLVLIIWNWGNSIDEIESTKSIFPIFQNWKIFFIGIGEGQFITAIHYLSPSYILFNFPTLPEWGIMLTFFEQGLVGVFLIIFLGISPLIFNKGKLLMPIFLFISFWIMSAEYLGTPNGILLALAFLFMKKNNGKI